jgi:hypothetical protein
MRRCARSSVTRSVTIRLRAVTRRVSPVRRSIRRSTSVTTRPNDAALVTRLPSSTQL